MKLPVRGRTGRPHWAQLHVPIEHEAAVVDLAVEVNRQLRHPCDGLAHVDQRRRPVGGDDPPGDPEISIEPAVEQRTAVHLDAEEPPVGDCLVGMGMDAQARRVGVGTNDAQARRATVAKTPGNEGASASGEASRRER